MLTLKRCCLIVVLIGLLTQCDSSEYNLTPTVAGYPMNVGAKWTYDRQVIIQKFDLGSSNHIIHTDTVNSEFMVWVDQDTVLNKETVKVFKSKEAELKFPSVQFILADKDGLKIYANQNSKLNIFTHQGLNLKLAAAVQSFNDTIFLEPSPILELKLPLLPDSKWTYKYSSKEDPLQIEKAVIGTETLTLTGMQINCYKLDWIYTKDPHYKGVQKTEWLSEKGLMKRVTTYNRVSFTDENNQPLYEGHYTETLTLKSFRYK